MKKVVSVVLCFVLLLGICSFNVSAKEDLKDYEEFIYESLMKCENEINLSKYEISSEQVSNCMEKMLNCYPEAACNIALLIDEETGGYYYDFGWSYSSATGFVTKLRVNYVLGREEFEKSIKLIDDTIAPILYKVRKMSEFEKALYIHDWICVNFMYDYRLFENGKENHDIIGFFGDKMGVCQSYAYTYMYMLRKVGIESQYVVSDQDNHGWNLVKIDGEWYHVDVTHDDPIIGEIYHYDYLGEVRHTNFLLSDNQILADGGHDGFYAPYFEQNGISVTCGEYKGNDSWRDAGSSVLKIGEYWYYLDSSSDAGGLMKTKDFDKVERVKEIGYHYVNEEQGIDLYGWLIGNKFYGGYFSGLFEYNEHLFFNDANEIYVYDTHHDVVNAVPIERPEDLHYFGLNMEGKTLHYLTSKSNIKTDVDVDGYYTLGAHIPTEWEVVKEPTKTEEGEKVKFCYICGNIIERQSIPSLGSVIAGDADGDGFVNTNDLAAEKLYLAGVLSEGITDGADYDKNGKIDTTDLASLKLFLAGLV